MSDVGLSVLTRSSERSDHLDEEEKSLLRFGAKALREDRYRPADCDV